MPGFYTAVFLIEFSIRLLFKIFFLLSQNEWLSYCLLGLCFFQKGYLVHLWWLESDLSSGALCRCCWLPLLSSELLGGKHQARGRGRGRDGDGSWVARDAPRPLAGITEQHQDQPFFFLCYVLESEISFNSTNNCIFRNLIRKEDIFSFFQCVHCFHIVFSLLCQEGFSS